MSTACGGTVSPGSVRAVRYPFRAPLAAPGGGVAGDRGEDDGVTADGVPAQVRDVLVKEPGNFPDD